MTDLRLERLEKTTERHDYLLRGNGGPGLVALVNRNTEQLDGLEESVTKLSATVDSRIGEVTLSINTLRAERKADYDKALGRRQLFNWVKFGISLAGGLLAIWLAVGQIQSQFYEINQQLQRIPNLPE